MKRVDIYEKYFRERDNKYLYYIRKPEEFVDYAVHETSDTHIKYCVACLDYFDTVLDVGYHQGIPNCPEDIPESVRNSQAVIYKAKIPSEVDGYPVMGIQFNDAEGTDYAAELELRLIVDLSESDLSNVIFMDFYELNTYLERFVLFPKNSHKVFRPVEITDVIYHNNEDEVKYLLTQMDLSELAYAERLFSETEITEFDFDKYNIHNIVDASFMFHGCINLKRVRGKHIGRGEIEADRMFTGCEELEEISEELFSGCKLTGINSMFYGCKMLRRFPLKTSNIGKLQVANTIRAFYGCSSTDDYCEGILKVVIYLLQRFPLDSGRGIVGGEYDKIVFPQIDYDVSRWYLRGILNTSEVSMLDLSKVNFIYVKSDLAFGIQDIFGECTTGFSAPNIVIANSTIRLNNADKIAFNIIDMREHEYDLVQAKINMIKAIDGQGHHLIIWDGYLK